MSELKQLSETPMYKFKYKLLRYILKKYKYGK